jgi:hypothetical protein
VCSSDLDVEFVAEIEGGFVDSQASEFSPEIE